ncbi:hypothetical protein SAMN05443635_11163 [Roseobacter denitrificans OCh 114]|nr:hypothetical protein SAMN05443635_11163 [Roseobacter denitrificans OCh 114]
MCMLATDGNRAGYKIKNLKWKIESTLPFLGRGLRVINRNASE